MGKNQKKKGKGAEKTAAKTEKNLTKKFKKQLAVKGEDDIAVVVAQFEKEQNMPQIIEKIAISPTRRAFSSLTPHPFKDELIMFGGEFHNGHETWVYNDLFFYNINTGDWKLIKAPGAPPPRTSHQAVAVPLNKGEIWIFGGEFTLKSESQFHHYRDLWQLELTTKRWNKIVTSGGPSARSGHRMVLYKRLLVVFGGYHDTLQECKYFNDIFTFDLDNRIWTKLEPSGTAPCPRSGCQMAVNSDGKIVIWGGYSKTKVKKNVEIGVAHSDMFLLTPEKGDTTNLKWKWSLVKPGGMKYGARSGVSMMYWSGKAFTFGGSSDHETEDEMTAEFHNELHLLDLQKLKWSQLVLTSKINTRQLKTTKNEECCDMEVEDTLEEKETVTDDGVFTMKIGPAPVKTPLPGEGSGEGGKSVLAHPHPRINASLAIKNSKLYLYGGLYEDSEKEYSLGDFYSIDINKLDEWKVLIPCDLTTQEWIESSESDETDSEGSTCTSGSDDEMED